MDNLLYVITPATHSTVQTKVAKLPFKPEHTHTNHKEINLIIHNCEQGVPCYETGCDWLRVEKEDSYWIKTGSFIYFEVFTV